MNKSVLIATKDLIHTNLSPGSNIKNKKEFLLTNIYLDRGLEHKNKYLVGYDKYESDYFVYAYLDELVDSNVVFPYVFIYKCLELEGLNAVINNKDKSLTVLQNSHILKVYSFDISYENALSMVDVDKIFIVNEDNEKFTRLDIEEKELKNKYLSLYGDSKTLNIKKYTYKRYFYLVGVLALLLSLVFSFFYKNYQEYIYVEKQLSAKNKVLKSLKEEVNGFSSLSNKRVISHIYSILSELPEFKLFLKNVELRENILFFNVYAKFDGNILEYLSKVKKEYKIIASKIEFRNSYYVCEIKVSFE